jgi:hypothetical protein
MSSTSPAALSAAAAALAPAQPRPTQALLEQLSRSTQGTSTFNTPLYGAGTEAPYPLWLLDPTGATPFLCIKLNNVCLQSAFWVCCNPAICSLFVAFVVI